jgi:rhomboid protease GluP
MPEENVVATELTPEQKFLIGIRLTTPRVFVTPLMVALNVAVFLAMVIKGVSFLEPSVDALIRWGANFGPLTTHGQWWRLLTSAFIHIGIIHILMNMYILYSSGDFVERLFGNLGFAVLYLLAGIGGSLVSLAWHPFTVAAGASGAIFGVYGGLFAFLAMQRQAIPGRLVASLSKNAAIFLGINLVYGASQAHVDMSAHMGGFGTGFLVGCALAQPFSTTRASRVTRSLVVLIAGTAMAAFCASRIPVVDDLQGELKHLSGLETASFKLFNDSLDQLRSDKIAAPAFDQIVNQQLLPPWNAEKASLQKLRVGAQQKSLVSHLVQYMSLRAEGWSLIAQGVSQNNSSLVTQANQKQAEAAEVAKSIGK